MENIKENRIEYIDLIKGFTILLVVLGHIYQYNNPIKIWIYSFHMPLFFIISGFFAKNNINLNKLLMKKFKSLIIPYISFGCCIILLMFLTEGLSDELKTYIVFFITGVGRDALWFLPALFVAELLFNVISKIKNNIIKCAFFISLFIIGLCGDYFIHNIILTPMYRSLVGLGFYVLGSYSFKYLNKINVSYITLFIVFVVDLFLALNNKCIDLWALTFNNRFIYLTCSILGSFCIILLFKNLSERNISNNILKFFGINTLIIMSSQQFIINCINKLTKMNYYNTLYGLAIFILVIVIEIPIIYIINNYIPWMLGKFIKREKLEVSSN